MKFDYNKTYYLVEDLSSFNANPEDDYVTGKFYFTDLEHLPGFFDQICWIQSLMVPKYAEVIIEEDKISASKIILGNKITFQDYIETLFDPDKFNWEYSGALARHCSEYCETWFDPDKFDWFYSHYLADFCSEHFKLWFDPEKYNWKYSDYLVEYCSEYKSIWSKYLK